MKITRTSPLTGEKATKEINVTPAQIAAWEGGEFAQSAFPDADIMLEAVLRFPFQSSRHQGFDPPP